MDTTTLIYLIFTFLALYFLSFFLILTIRNRTEFFTYPKPNKEYYISVLIPAHNEEDSIAETIEHVALSDYPKEKVEIIVINNASTDRTKEVIEKLLKKYKNLQLINTNIPGKANSLNLGIKEAKGELIAVVDSDSFPERGSLRKLTGYFNDAEMGAVTSFVTIRNKNSNFLTKIQSMEYILLAWNRKLLDFVDSVYVTNGPLSLYRKSYVLRAGGFDPNSMTEDIDITWNLMQHGYKTAMCLDARVSTIAPTKFKAWFRQRLRWGIGGIQAIQKYRKMFFKKGMFGFFIIPYVSLSIILGIFLFVYSLYLFFRSLATSALTLGYSFSTGSSAFDFADINLHPSVTIFFFIVLFTFSTIFSIYVFNVLEEREKISIKRFFNLMFYTLVYLSLYPVIWFATFYRIIRKDYKW